MLSISNVAIVNILCHFLLFASLVAVAFSSQTLKLFAAIFTDDRGAEYDMFNSLTECQGVASDYAADTTGLTALSTMGKCYEEEMDALDEVYTGQYKPSLPEYNNFWRLIDPEESILFAMVDHVDDTLPVSWMRSDDMFGWVRLVGSNPDMLRIATSADFNSNFDVTDAMYNTAMGESGSGTLGAALAEVRVREERSDELRSRVYVISILNS